MNYKESQEILSEIKKAKKVLVNCHFNPDPDSIGSALAMYRVLEKSRKDAKIVCPSSEIDNSLNFLSDFGKIRKGLDFSSFDFSKYDLFITLDSSSWEMVSGLKDFVKPTIKVIVIDHHITNNLCGDINIVDPKVTSTAEILYLIFCDWKVDIDEKIANYLLAGIIGDTGAFSFPNSGKETLRIAADLIDEGANKDEILQHLYRTKPFGLFKFYGEALRNIKLDKKGRFVWVAVPYKIYKRFGFPLAKESLANLFAQVVDGTDFGFVIVEREPQKVSVSFRSRTGIDTSKIAKELGGGGHRLASGAKIEGLSFKDAVDKILYVARKYAKGK